MRYMGTPFRIVIPGMPRPSDGVVPTEAPRDGELEMPATLAINGVSTPQTSMDRAKRQADALLRQCQERVAAGRTTAILELLDINPEFIKNAWVRDTCIRLGDEGRLRRAPGRPIGRDKVCPMVVVGLVGHLIETRRTKNREQAFGVLEDLGLMTYSAAKDSFYRGWREPRFKPIYLEFPELEREMTAEEVAYFMRAEMVEAGRTAKRTLKDPQLGHVEFGLSGLS
jgi:hypothetical protein